jgi:hypothetical protein
MRVGVRVRVRVRVRVVLVVEGARSTTSARAISPGVIVVMLLVIGVRGVHRGTGIALS